MKARKRRRNRNAGAEAAPPAVVISKVELYEIRNLLARAKFCTDPVEQAQILAKVATYRNSYFKTAQGNLRRVFPKDFVSKGAS